jgi:hypothetical protein
MNLSNSDQFYAAGNVPGFKTNLAIYLGITQEQVKVLRMSPQNDLSFFLDTQRGDSDPVATMTNWSLSVQSMISNGEALSRLYMEVRQFSSEIRTTTIKYEENKPDPGTGGGTGSVPNLVPG